MRTVQKTMVTVILALLVTICSFGVTMAATVPPPSIRPGNVVQLTTGPTEHIEPTFSPDGKYIAFSSNQAGSYDLWIMRDDGRQLTMISSLPGEEVAPAWSPEGSSLAFIWKHGPYSDLCTASVIKDSPKCLTDGLHVSTFSWSPDGLAIAYDGGNGTILFHNMTNGTDTKFPFNGYVSDPAFGPNTNFLYFSLRTPTGNYIWNASIDGANGRQLSWEGSDVRPQASPTGNYLVYLTNLSGRYEPWLVDLRNGINAYLLNRPDLGGSYTFPAPPLLVSGTVPQWGPNGASVLMLANGNGSGNQGDVYLVTLNFPVNLASQAVNPVPATIPQGQDLILNVYNRVPVSELAGDAQWSSSGNVVIQANISGFEQLVLLRNGPPVRVGYGG